MKIAILAGGSGSRLFPLSRESFPKQFIDIDGSGSFFKKTFYRALKAVNPEDIVISTSKNYTHLVENQIGNYKDKINIVDEPLRRNTAPAIAYMVSYFIDNNETKDTVLAVLPSDHFISPDDKFVEYLKNAEKIAKEGYIVTFGVIPNKPETGYGYIEASSKQIFEGFKVERFHEKPSLKTAIEYLEKGNFYWNSGIFVFRIDVMLEELGKNSPEIFEIIKNGFSYTKENFSKMPDISIDYAIMEKTDKAVVIPFNNLVWSDVGSWDSVYEVLNKDECKNAVKGEFIGYNCKNCLVIGDSKTIIGVDIEDLHIVDTRDTLLVMKKGSGQKVRDVTKNFMEHATLKNKVLNAPLEYRHWGFFIVLEEGKGYKIKRLFVYPRKSLSLQLHKFRSEHWTVIKGTATVILQDKDGSNERKLIVKENESIYIGKEIRHKLINNTDEPLEIIEVQVGDYLGEDDIERFDVDKSINV